MCENRRSLHSGGENDPACDRDDNSYYGHAFCTPEGVLHPGPLHTMPAYSQKAGTRPAFLYLRLFSYPCGLTRSMSIL